MIEGRSKAVFKQRARRPKDRRDRIEVVAMEGFTGFKTVASEELPDGVAVMDPFHVVRLPGNALDKCRQRVHQATRGHRDRSGTRLYAARRTLHTSEKLLTQKQLAGLQALFAVDDHVEVEVTWSIYQQMITAYREPDRTCGKSILRGLIDSISIGVSAPLVEVITLGRTLTRRAVDVLASFDRPGTSNGPTGAINGRLEHLRGSALGLKDLSNYIARSPLESGGLGPLPHSGLR
jgi:transposase